MAAASLPLALLVAVAASPPQGSHCANHSAGCWFNRAGKNCSAANSERDCGAQLVCLRDLCRQCTADSECNYIPEQVCRQSDAYRICSHKDMWPMDARDVAGLAVAFMATALAAGGGIGGGGLLVPLFIVVLAFTPHDATPLSSIAILGGSLATLALNLRRRNPSGLRGGLRPLISFEVALMMEPLTIAAALIGCVINKVSPGWLLALLLAGLLTHTSWRTMCKGVATWRKESAAADAAVEGYSSLSPHRRPTSTAASPFTIAAATPTNTVVPLMPAEIMGRSQVMGRSEPRSAEIAISPGFGQA